MNDLPTIRAVRVGGPSMDHFKPYVYGGDQFIKDEKKTRETSPPCDEDGCDATSHAVRLCRKHYRVYLKAIKTDPSLRRNAPPGFRPDKCGTQAGFQRHTYYNLDPCGPCIEANNIDRAERKAAMQARKEERHASDATRRG